jgi:hypothetical protein
VLVEAENAGDVEVVIKLGEGLAGGLREFHIDDSVDCLAPQKSRE